MAAAAFSLGAAFCLWQKRILHHSDSSAFTQRLQILSDSFTCVSGCSSVLVASAEVWNESQGMHTVWTNQPSSAENAFRRLLVTMYVVSLTALCRFQHVA